MKRIYVAGPYTLGDVAQNVATAIKAGDDLLDLGYVPFVPHLTHFWHMLRPRLYPEWVRYDLQWLPFCDGLLRLPGDSDGADREVQKATELGIPVFFGWAEFSMRRYSYEVPVAAS